MFDESIELTKEERDFIESTKEIIEKNKDNPEGMAIITESMNRVYKYFKSVIKEANIADPRLFEVFLLESIMEQKFLPLNSEPIFTSDAPVIPTTIATEKDCEDLMAYIVHENRKILSEMHDIKTASLKRECVSAAHDIKKICENLGVSQTMYQCNQDLSVGLFHSFNVVTICLPDGRVKNYLIDCTYRQFFTCADNFLERTGMPMSPGANMGAFMLMDESRKQFAEELLTKGYVEFTEENIKNYFDGFIFSGRNGLYYDQLDKQVLEKSDYEPQYTASDYIFALYSGGLKQEQYIGRQYGVLKKDIEFGTLESLTNQGFKK